MAYLNAACYYFLIRFNNSAQFEIYGVTRSYSSSYVLSAFSMQNEVPVVLELQTTLQILAMPLPIIMMCKIKYLMVEK